MSKSEQRKEAIRFYNSWRWKKLRYRVLLKYGPTCMLCGASRSDGVRIVVDHISPRSKSPEKQLDFDNCQVLCNACNKGKGRVDETDFRPDVPAPKEGAAQDTDESDTAGIIADGARFLVRKTLTGRAHIWNGEDSLCHMATTGGMNLDKYRLTDTPIRPVCTMCRRVARTAGIMHDDCREEA